MFVRGKKSGKRVYLQVVENRRQNGRVRQKVIGTLGRLDRLHASGALDSLIASCTKFSEKLSVLGAHERGELTELRSGRIGPGLVFGRLWEELGIRECLKETLADRRFRFSVERAIFLTVVHRLMLPGSDRAADRWRENYVLPDTEDIDLHHLYRAMAWLGEVLPKNEQEGNTKHSPRCVKDVIEERLFARQRDLFSDLAILFFDTTSLYFHGEGGETLGRRGKSKDFRGHLKQMVVGLVLNEAGRPICCEIWPGNTADVSTVVPLLQRLQKRFHVTRVCLVGDRGMVSKGIIDYLEAHEFSYVLGAKMRNQKEVKEEVLARAGRYRVVRPGRNRAKDPSPLKVKEVWVEDRRYIVCLNEEQARRDAAEREAILTQLREKLRSGSKSLVKNKGFRRYLKTTESAFEVDENRVKAEARLDGKWVLTTNTDMDAAAVALTYKDLWMVEAIFRSVKSVLETRPVFHKTDETIRGHVFCSFLALLLMRELQYRMWDHGWGEAEWEHLLRDLAELTETEVRASDGKCFRLRVNLSGWCGKVFQAVGVALPHTVRPAGEH
ncbi:MAG: IS1634 family transposase [Armatimonadia bacterium]|nr:IS1634 family transposase [Armatimonadia bacterium]